jgi:hypothetical protein
MKYLDQMSKLSVVQEGWLAAGLDEGARQLGN